MPIDGKKHKPTLNIIIREITMHTKPWANHYPKDYIKILKFFKENINKQIDDLIMEVTND